MGEKRKTLVLVDDDITNLQIGKNALSATYNVFTLPSAAKLFLLLGKIKPDMILLDIDMPEVNGYDAIRHLKEDPDTRTIPVIFLTAKNDVQSEIKGLTLGAVDYISKPISPPLLLKRIELHILMEDQRCELKSYNDNLQRMVAEKTNTVFELQNTILKTVAELVEFRDGETGGHIERTQSYLRILIEAMIFQGLYPEETASWDVEQLLLSSQLHDVGKISISDSILRKPEGLTPDELEEMKKHTVYGVKIIDEIERNTKENTFLAHAKIFAGSHHERWDGTGYPQGLKGLEIPLLGRLMAIADVYDALISERIYKKPVSHEKAVKIIFKGRGTHFEPALADLFLSVSSQFDAAAKRINNEDI